MSGQGDEKDAEEKIIDCVEVYVPYFCFNPLESRISCSFRISLT